jgi:hypothetical protein
VDAVSGFEDVHVHRFTDDGKYLICFSRNQHDLVVYRFRGFGEAETPRRAEAAGPRTPRDARGGDRDADGDENKPPRRAPATTRDKYFDLLYTRPLTVDADLLARDFAVTILEGEYLLVASSTPAEAPPRDAAARERTNADEAGTADGVPARGPRAGAAAPGGGGGGRGGGAAYETTPSGSAEASASADASAAAARASGAAAVARARAEAEADTAARRGAGRPNATTTLPGSPTMDTVALHLVRLRDGRVCDRRVYRDDYVRLRRAAAVSVFAETKSSCLVSVLSLRWQAFRVLRVSLRSTTETETERAREVAAGSSEGDPSLSDPANGGEDDPIAVFADARTPVGSACAPDDDAPLAAQDQAEREWRLARRRDYLGDGFFSGDDEQFDDFSTGGDSAEENLVETPSGTTTTLPRPRTRGGTSSGAERGSTRRNGVTELRGWSDPESLMYAGIKQKLITRVLLEARRRDAEAAAAEARDAEAHMSSDAGPDPADVRSSPKRRGVKRDAASAFVPSVSAPPTEAERLAYKRRERLTEKTRGGTRSFTPPRRGAFTSAFFSRYWSYAEWMVLWHVQLLDERRALLRFGTAEDVLAWGTRRSRAEAGVHPGSERCPESVLIAVMDWVEGTVEHVGDAAGAGGGPARGCAGDHTDRVERRARRRGRGGGRSRRARAAAGGGLPLAETRRRSGRRRRPRVGVRRGSARRRPVLGRRRSARRIGRRRGIFIVFAGLVAPGPGSQPGGSRARVPVAGATELAGALVAVAVLRHASVPLRRARGGAGRAAAARAGRLAAVLGGGAARAAGRGAGEGARTKRKRRIEKRIRERRGAYRRRVRVTGGGGGSAAAGARRAVCVPAVARRRLPARTRA